MTDRADAARDWMHVARRRWMSAALGVVGQEAAPARARRLLARAERRFERDAASAPRYSPLPDVALRQLRARARRPARARG
jgi:hypothetical protein